MLKQLKKKYDTEDREVVVDKGPFTVKTPTGLEVRIDAEGNVTIVGHNALKFKCEGEMEFEADNITMRTKHTHRIESEKHIIQKAARIDFNPLSEDNLEIPKEGAKYIEYALTKKHNCGDH